MIFMYNIFGLILASNAKDLFDKGSFGCPFLFIRGNMKEKIITLIYGIAPEPIKEKIEKHIAAQIEQTKQNIIRLRWQKLKVENQLKDLKALKNNQK